jgi:hypothetical protein
MEHALFLIFPTQLTKVRVREDPYLRVRHPHCSLLPVPTAELVPNLRNPHRPHPHLHKLLPDLVRGQKDLQQQQASTVPFNQSGSFRNSSFQLETRLSGD